MKIGGLRKWDYTAFVVFFFFSLSAEYIYIGTGINWRSL